MTVLTERKSWRRVRQRPRRFDLTETEKANVKKTIRMLRGAYGNARRLAVALGMRHDHIRSLLTRRGQPTPALAHKLARLMGVPVEEVLTATWPRVGAWAAARRDV